MNGGAWITTGQQSFRHFFESGFRKVKEDSRVETEAVGLEDFSATGGEGCRESASSSRPLTAQTTVEGMATLYNFRMGLSAFPCHTGRPRRCELAHATCVRSI